MRNKKIIICSIMIIFIASIVLIVLITKGNHSIKETSSIQIGDMIVLTNEQKKELRNKTIESIKGYLKTPSIAEFQEDFSYICTEPNIVKVEGYVDSQNSFGAMIRENFICEYFIIDNVSDTLVYIKYNDEEIFDMKDIYIEEYKKQNKLENIKKNGNELNKEKLDYIMNEFNEEEINDVAKITNVVFDERETIIKVQINAKTEISDNYWIDFNICSIMDYIKEFKIVGKVKIELVDKEKKVEVVFDDKFLENKWKDNHQINLVKEIFGENYKEI